jgi:DNA-binding NarL/FixJ family response regulator
MVDMDRVERWPMVGRHEEMAHLADVAGDPTQRGVIVAGQPGVGKTRLVREALRSLPESHVAWVMATASAQGLPFGAFAHLLPHDLQSVERIDLLAVIGRHLLSGAEERSCVLAVDDVHLLDPSSAALVHHMVTIPKTTVFLTLRSGEAAPDAISSLYRADVISRLELQPISRDEFDELIGTALDGLVEEATLNRLWEMTRGNTLFARELLADAKDAGSLVQDHGVWRWSGKVGRASRLRETIAERLQGLDDPTRRVLELLSVGEPLSSDTLEHLVPGVDLSDLERRALVVLDGVLTPSGLRLSHPLLGEVLRATMPGTTRRELSRDLAEYFRSYDRLGPSDLLRFAKWKQAAGVDLEDVALLEAAKRANQLGDHTLAEELVLEASARGDLGARLELALALAGQNRFDDAAAELHRLVPGRELVDQDRERLADAIAQVVGFGMDQIDEAEEAMAAVAMTIVDPALQAMVQCHRANLLAFKCRFAEAAELGVAALAQAAEDSVRVRTLNSVGMSLVMAGRTTEALELAEQALPAALALSERYPRAPSWVFSTRWTALAMGGRLDEALEEIGAVVKLGPLPQAVLAQANSLRGRLHLAQGRVQTACRFLYDSAVTAREIPIREPSWCLALAAEAEAIQGHLEDAEALAEEARSLRRGGVLVYEVDERRALAWVDVQAGRIGAGIEQLWEASEIAATRGQRCFDLIILNDLLRLGERQAIGLIEESAPKADGTLAAAVLDHARAAATRDLAEVEVAAQSFESIGFSLVAAELWSAAAAGYRESGRRSAATAATKSASRLSNLCEGARTQPLSWIGDTATNITRRQREIALLAARGATNAQIAAELTLSLRTVESHLYNVFVKLNVSDRSQLASALERASL